MKHLWTILIASLILAGCSGDDPAPPIPDPDPELIANAGPDQTVQVFNEVTLDATGSSGGGSTFISYEWAFTSGPGDLSAADILFNFQTSANATFTPPLNGVYVFTLTATSLDQTDTDEVQITVSGALILGGTITEPINLLNIELDPSLPDYSITSDLIISDGGWVLITESDIVINVGDDVGILVEDGGLLENGNTNDTKFTSDNGWNGIHVQGGVLKLSGATIELAGKNAFDGQEDAGALILGSDATFVLSNIEFKESFSFDLVALFSLSGTNTFTNVTFSNSIPIKAYIGFLNFLQDDENFTYPSNLEYLILTTNNGSSKDPGVVFNSHPYYITGEYVTGNVTINEGAHVMFEENTGLLILDGALTIAGTETNPVTMEGFNSASWKGIAGAATVNYLIINDAGSDLFEFSDAGFSFQSQQKAALYDIVSLSNSNIVNSLGYGIYYLGVTGTILDYNNNTIENSISPAIFAANPGALLPDNHQNTFVMSEGIAAIEYGGGFKDGGIFSSFTYPLIGENNFYLFHDLTVHFDLTILPGTILRFASGSTLSVIGSNPGSITAIGDASNPVIFDSEAETPGSWNGMILSGNYNLQYCEIQNGGENLIEGATEKGNVIFKNSSFGANLVFSNNTISGGAGYGIVIESGAVDPLDGTNSAPNNALGPVIRK